MDIVALSFAIVAIAAVVYGVSRQASADRVVIRDLLKSNRDTLDRAVSISEARETLMADTVRKLAAASDQANALAQLEIQRDMRIMDQRDDAPRQSGGTPAYDEADQDGVVESEWSDTEVGVG